MKERESLLVCPYFLLDDRNVFKAFPFLKVKCFHQNAFFNDLNAKESEVETPVKRKELQAAKEVRSEILHTHHKVNGYGIVERNARFVWIYQQAYRKVKCREIQQNQTQVYKKGSIVLLKNKLEKTHIQRVSQEKCARFREGVPYVKVYRYNPKHLCPKLNGYGDNGQKRLKL